MRVDEVIGQAGVRQILLRLLRKGRFPHGLLLEGRPATGRSTLARAAAQALLCESPQEGDACGRCPQCQQVVAETHPDFVLVGRGPKAYAIDYVRDELVDRAYDSPLQAGRRVFVLPDIDRMRLDAANALLKVLEEPPASTYFIMSKRPGRNVLPTIISRVQLLRCAPLAQDEVFRVLLATGTDQVEARRRSTLSQGSHQGLGEGDLVEDCPLDALFALLHEEPSQTRVSDVLECLPGRSPDDGFTDAAWQRHTCERWLDVLVAEIRQRLRSGAAHRLVDDLERVLRVRGGLGLNLTPRQVVEQLAYAC